MLLALVVVVVAAVVAELLSVALSLLDSVGVTSDVDAVGLSPVLLLPLVSRRSIILDTEAIPALTSLLTSEPRSATDELREKSLSFHPRVLFVMDSLYLDYTKVTSIFMIKSITLEGSRKNNNRICILHRDSIQARLQGV